MSRTKSLRRQHDAASEIVAQISTLTEGLVAKPDRNHAYAVAMALGKLTGLLRIHFAQEDKMLYPALMASPDMDVAGVAKRFFDEMGSIGPAFGAFVQRWNSGDAILANPKGFRDDSGRLFGDLMQRIERENSILYPLADAETVEEVRQRPAA